jgi:Pyruvate/2-oxoacid:ferredoxin oxidoreductase delta subunit
MIDPEKVYDKLAEKYKQPGFEHFRDILQAMMNPEEGEIVLALSEPLTPAELAEKMNIDENILAKQMDSLARRGVLFRGKEQYVAWGSAHQLNARVMFSADENIPPNFLELRRQDQRYSGQPYAEIDGMLKMNAAKGRPSGRVLPARLAILANPRISPDQVLWYEDVAKMLERAEIIGMVDCDCRRIYHRCDKPLDTCLHFTKNVVEYEIGRGGRMKVITVDKAIALLEAAEKGGLVHTSFNYSSLAGVMCSCCNDCCSSIEPALHDGKVHEIFSPSRYRPAVDLEKCIGCQSCFKICPFRAIEMEKIPGSKNMKAGVIEAECMGCGVCVLQCKKQALTFELVRPPEHIPSEPAGFRTGMGPQPR